MIAMERSVRPRASTLVIAKRNLLKFLRTPQLLVLGSIQSAMFLLIFRYVFGGAIDAGTIDYVDFLAPGFITTGLLFYGMGAATGMGGGPRARLRGSTPLPSDPEERCSRAEPSPIQRCLGTGHHDGDRFRRGVSDPRLCGRGLAAFGLCLVFGFAFEWVFITLGLMEGNAEAAQRLAFMVFPLSFVSSAFVPVESMPGWMQAFANISRWPNGRRGPCARIGQHRRSGGARPLRQLLRGEIVIWAAAWWWQSPRWPWRGIAKADRRPRVAGRGRIEEDSTIPPRPRKGIPG